MARMSSDEGKRVVLTLRITAGEHAQLSAQAEQQKMSMNEYARYQLFGTPPQANVYAALEARLAEHDQRISTLDAAINQGRKAIQKED